MLKSCSQIIDDYIKGHDTLKWDMFNFWFSHFSIYSCGLTFISYLVCTVLGATFVITPLIAGLWLLVGGLCAYYGVKGYFDIKKTFAEFVKQ